MVLYLITGIPIAALPAGKSFTNFEELPEKIDEFAESGKSFRRIPERQACAAGHRRPFF
jgi:hypothetical protein